MAQQIGDDAREHKDLVDKVVADMGSPEDPASAVFWQSPDVTGFSDYHRLFYYREKVTDVDGTEAEEKAKQHVLKWENEDYDKDQVINSKWQASYRGEKEPASHPVG